MQAERETYRKVSSRWAVLDSETTTDVHVLPCNDDGVILGPHIASRYCPCTPARDDQIPNLFLHEMIM